MKLRAAEVKHTDMANEMRTEVVDIIAGGGHKTAKHGAEDVVEISLGNIGKVRIE